MTMWDKLKALFTDAPPSPAPQEEEEKPGVQYVRTPAGNILEVHPDGRVIDTAEAKRISRAYRDDQASLQRINTERTARGEEPFSSLEEAKREQEAIPRWLRNI